MLFCLNCAETFPIPRPILRDAASMGPKKGDVLGEAVDVVDAREVESSGEGGVVLGRWAREVEGLEMGILVVGARRGEGFDPFGYDADACEADGVELEASFRSLVASSREENCSLGKGSGFALSVLVLVIVAPLSPLSLPFIKLPGGSHTSSSSLPNPFSPPAPPPEAEPEVFAPPFQASFNLPFALEAFPFQS